MVGTGGFEPPTSAMSRQHSDQLSYVPGFKFVKLLKPDLSLTQADVVVLSRLIEAVYR